MRPLHSRSEGPPVAVDAQQLAQQLARACFRQVLAVNQVGGALPGPGGRRQAAGREAAALRPRAPAAGAARAVIATPRGQLAERASPRPLPQLLLLPHEGGDLVLRVTRTDTLSEQEQQEALGYHCYRGLLAPATAIYLTADGAAQQAAGPSAGGAAAGWRGAEHGALQPARCPGIRQRGPGLAAGGRRWRRC